MWSTGFYCASSFPRHHTDSPFGEAPGKESRQHLSEGAAKVVRALPRLLRILQPVIVAFEALPGPDHSVEPHSV